MLAAHPNHQAVHVEHTCMLSQARFQQACVENLLGEGYLQGPGRQDWVSSLRLMNKDFRDVWTHLRSHSREGSSRTDPDHYLWSVCGSVNLGYRFCGFESVMKATKTDINYEFISEWSCPLCSDWQNYHRHTKTHYRAKENSGGWPRGMKQGPKIEWRER